MNISCLSCNLNFSQKEKEQKFCSRSCAASYNNKKKKMSLESRQKISDTIRMKFGLSQRKLSIPNPSPILVAVGNKIPFTKVRVCTYCKKYFNHDLIKSQSVCSDECFINIKTKLNKKGKRQIYKDISFDSSWEV